MSANLKNQLNNIKEGKTYQVVTNLAKYVGLQQMSNNYYNKVQISTVLSNYTIVIRGCPLITSKN